MQIDLADLQQGVSIAASLNWRALYEAFCQEDYADAADIALEDALLVSQPWLPQAGTARFVLHLAYTMAKSVSGDKKATGTITIEDLAKGLVAAEGVDWNGFLHALKDGNAIEVAGDTGEVLSKLATPFFPPATISAGVFTAVAYLGAFTHPATPYHIDGMDWSPLWGWVPKKDHDNA